MSDSIQEHHEPKHAAVHVEITGENKGETDSFAVPEGDPRRRDHIPTNDSPAMPPAAGAEPTAKVPGEHNASEGGDALAGA